MTASPLLAGSTGRDPRAARPALGRSGATAHAVARPVVDGLDASLCGQLVTVSASEDWATAWSGDRCEECARLAG
ncbi:hypothetical protein [Blastococcus litoris]|uniref:hypothetical protein n=1 Tax=Blastococcus litoris TaxID=2171622 RepID=UPI000E300986|nr:hypothetical protein [Blastococcus litoris]